MMAVGCGARSNAVILVDGREAVRVRGKVEIVDSDIGMLVLAASDDTIRISFNEKVAISGFQSLAELKVGNPLEVVYFHDNRGNSAVSIKKLPEGSCDS